MPSAPDINHQTVPKASNSEEAYQGQHDGQSWIKPVTDLYHRFRTTSVRVKLRLVTNDLRLVDNPSVVDAFTHLRTSAPNRRQQQSVQERINGTIVLNVATDGWIIHTKIR